MSDLDVQRRPDASRRRRHGRARRRFAWWRRHRILGGVLALLVLATPVWYSMGTALTNPSLGVSLAGRLAEWTRDHGGASVVAWGENLWYSHHAPPTGGRPPAGAIPKPGVGTATGTTAAGPAHLPPPQSIAPLAAKPLPGEGQWHPAGRRVAGLPAVYEAFLRPDAVHTSLVVGVAWMDTKLLRARLYGGSYIPGHGPWHYTAPITPSAATGLVAAFNSGFRLQDAQGGWYSEGRAAAPLRDGQASLVIYSDGSVNIGAWNRDVHMSPRVVSVRQNLGLLVDHGAPVAGLNANDTSAWGATLGNAVYVWRSGLGITANGALVYVGGPGLNITSLADLLVRAGAVRAMELDINTDWVDFATYRPATPGGAATPANGRDMLSTMVGTPQRYFETWWSRDFITMSARTGAGS